MNYQQKRKQYVIKIKLLPEVLPQSVHIHNKLHFLQHIKYFNLVLAFNLLEKPFSSTSLYVPEDIVPEDLVL